MPLLTDEKRIAELRTQFPTLTHTSWKELPEIVPHPNVDKHHQQMGDIVCATNSDSDFYALRCNERQGMINYSIPYRDSKGKVNRIFIFEKMKDTYYEHVVSSANFTPIVSEKGVFSGEWVSHDTITPLSVKVGHKEDVLKRTPARVFTISNMEHFKEKLNDDSFVKMIRNSNTSLEAVTKLVDLGILKAENKSGRLRTFLFEHTTDYGDESSQNATSKKELSEVQQAALRARLPQNG